MFLLIYKIYVVGYLLGVDKLPEFHLTLGL